MNEIWKTIPNFSKYEVSNQGNVRNKKSHRPLKPHTHKTGYNAVSLSDDNKKMKTQYVHRLVASTFIGDLNDKVVNHKNFIKSDNRVENLEITTQYENIRYNYNNINRHRLILDIQKAVDSVLQKYIETQTL